MSSGVLLSDLLTRFASGYGVFVCQACGSFLFAHVI